MRAQVAALPGVMAATASTRLPVNGGEIMNGGSPFSIEGRPWNPSGAVPQLANTQIADPVYFRTLQIPLIAGRVFNDSDTAQAPFVAVINETLARGFFPDGDAIGHRILLGAPRPDSKMDDHHRHCRRRQGRRAGPAHAPAILQVPLSQHPDIYMQLAIRTSGDPTSIASQAAAVVRSIDPDAPVYGVQTMDQRIAGSVSQPRFETVILAFFAAAALFLAAIGIFGVVAHSTARRTQEIGIRMALGADRARVVRYVVGDGLRPVFSGAAIGLAGAFALGRVLAGTLFHVTPRDPQIFTLATAALIMVAIGACLIPARRASRIDPMNALRSE